MIQVRHDTDTDRLLHIYNIDYRGQYRMIDECVCECVCDPFSL